jgi:hypothetical protein
MELVAESNVKDNELSLAKSEIEVLNQRIQVFEDEVSELYQD